MEVALCVLICILSVVLGGAFVFIERQLEDVRDLLEGILHCLPCREDNISPSEDAELRRKLMN